MEEYCVSSEARTESFSYKNLLDAEIFYEMQ